MPKKKINPKKRDKLMIIPWITMVIASITLIFVIVSLGYLWYYSAVLEPMVQLGQNQFVLEKQIRDLPGVTPPPHTWPTYESEEAGFSIQYPPGWTFTGDSTGIFFQTESKSQFDTHSIRVEETDKTLEEWADSIDKSVVNRTIYMDIDNEPAIGVYIGELPPGLLMATKHNDKLYIFSSAGELMDKNNMLLFFKFID